MTRTIKLNAIKNNELTIISTIRLIRPCETSSSVFKTTWPTLHSSPVLPSRRYMASGWPAVVPSVYFSWRVLCLNQHFKIIRFTFVPYIKGFLQSGVLVIRGLAIRGSYNQGFLRSGVLQSMVLTIRGSYNQGFLQPGVLTIRGLTINGSYNQGF